MTMQVKLAAALVGIIILLGSHWYAYNAGSHHKEASMENKYLKDYAANLQAAADKTYQLQQQKDEALNASAKRESYLLADAANARSESSRLRESINSIKSTLPHLTEQAVRQYADAASVVFNECQERYTALAEQADRIDNDRQTLEAAWPK